jgi:hypothetical protein
MQSLDEKRVFAPDRPARTLYVGTDRGLIALSVAGVHLGRYSMAIRGTVHALCATPAGVIAAVDDRVEAIGGAELPSTMPATTGEVAVLGADAAAVWTATDDLVTRYPCSDGGDPGRYRTGGAVTAIAPPFIGTTDGLLRYTPDGLQSVGLEQVTALTSAPLVGTTEGLYTLGNGWMRQLEGHVLAAASHPSHSAAATDTGIYTGASGWAALDAPPAPSVALAVSADVVYAISADGIVMAHLPGEPWTQTHLGVGGITGVVIAPTTNGKHPPRAEPT